MMTMKTAPTWQLLKLTPENLKDQHICCALSGNNDRTVAAKKAWLADRLPEGLVFLKADIRGKCFIEYLPAEKAWCPLTAPGYMYIDCFWVSGSLAGHGYGDLLLKEAIRDSKQKGKQGLCVLSSPTKRPFLSDPAYLKYRGFQLADTADPFFELLYLPFSESVDPPHFKQTVKKPAVTASGFVLYYSHQCPFPVKYAALLGDYATQKGGDWQAVCFQDLDQAQNAPTPATTYSLFYQRRFLTNEILSIKAFEQLIRDNGITL